MLRKVIILVALGCALAVAQVPEVKEDGIPVPEVKVGIPPQPSLSESPTTTSTVPPTKGTTTVSPTPHPNTTAAPTSAPTTQPSTPAPPPPPTTEPPAPSSTPAPPTKRTFVIRSAKNETCLIADFAVQLDWVENNKTSTVEIPQNVTYNQNVSSCSNLTQELSLSWRYMDKNNSLNFQFAKNETTKKFMVSSITFSIRTKNDTLNVTEDKPMFTASVSKSYRCEKEQEIKLKEEATNTTYAILKLSHLQLEAFHTGNDTKFSAAEDCAGGSSPDIVPIAVGCALVGLIAIVLIAYLVGRRRSQARGYLSM